MAAFPTPAALAAAIAARGGIVPADVEGLMALSATGPYTARAVVAIAFGFPVSAVDVNVSRVVGPPGLA